jgi:anti-sigma28 factor (negative regulator of flagellin synthesis)
MSSSIPPVKTTSTPASQPTSPDETVTSFSSSANSFSGLVQQAGAMPDVRSELVDSFKSRIQSGQYPSSETMDALTDVIGNGIVKMASE